MSATFLLRKLRSVHDSVSGGGVYPAERRNERRKTERERERERVKGEQPYVGLIGLLPVIPCVRHEFLLRDCFRAEWRVSRTRCSLL